MECYSAKFPDVHNSASVRDLGVTLDAVLSFLDHVKRISRICLYYLHELRTIRHSLESHAIRNALNALNCTRVDFCMFIYARLSSLNISKLSLVNT